MKLTILITTHHEQQNGSLSDGPHVRHYSLTLDKPGFRIDDEWNESSVRLLCCDALTAYERDPRPFDSQDWTYAGIVITTHQKTPRLFSVQVSRKDWTPSAYGGDIGGVFTHSQITPLISTEMVI